MRFCTAAEEAAARDKRKEQERLENSRTARWANYTKRFLDMTAQLANEIRDERMIRLVNKSIAQEAEQLRKYKPLKLRSRKRCTQKRSALLNLPAEIRIMIWEHLMARKFIVLYRKWGDVTSIFVDKDDATSVDSATSSIMRSISMPGSKSGVFPLLQTCQTTYLETITMLYQDNTFVCLDNGVLVELCREPPRFNMSGIRSLHYFVGIQKFLSNETSLSEREMIPSPTHAEESESVSKVFHERFPKLQNLTMFLYGPLRDSEDYTNMLAHLQNMYQQRISITMNALGMPEGYLYSDRVTYNMNRSTTVRILEGSRRPAYSAVRPPGAELDGPSVENFTWRANTLWLRPHEETGEVGEARKLVYVVLRPEDESRRTMQSSEPSILWDVIPDS